MKVAILGGAGAMGAIFGADLAQGGADVTLIDVSPEAIAAVRRDGLVVEDRDGQPSVHRLPITDRPAEVGPVDLVVVFVKGYHTAAAMEAATPLIGPDTAVLTLQNGWGNAQRIGAAVGMERVLVGLTYNSGSLLGPGRVRHTARGATVIGELSGQTTARLEAVAAALRRGGLDATLSDRIVEEVWKKLSLNACALPPSALLGCVARELAEVPAARDLVGMILREVVEVARAGGIALDYDERFTAITAALTRAGNARASMLQDVEAKRRTEIENINGAIVEAGRAAGVATPVNEAMVRLIEALQARYLPPPPA